MSSDEPNEKRLLVRRLDFFVFVEVLLAAVFFVFVFVLGSENTDRYACGSEGHSDDDGYDVLLFRTVGATNS